MTKLKPNKYFDKRVNEVYVSQVKDLREVLTLTDWECDFINSIDEQLGEGLPMTQRQVITLSDLWHKKKKAKYV